MGCSENILFHTLYFWSLIWFLLSSETSHVVIVCVFTMDFAFKSLSIFTTATFVFLSAVCILSSQSKLLWLQIHLPTLTFLVYFICIEEVLEGETVKGCLGHVGLALRNGTGSLSQKRHCSSRHGFLIKWWSGVPLVSHFLSVSLCLSPPMPTPCYDAKEGSC